MSTKPLSALFLLLLCISIRGYSQAREDTKVFVRPVTGGTEEENDYFHDNFITEIEAARYTIVDSEEEADFAFRIKCLKGNDESGEWKSVEITIIELPGGHEVITYSWDYTTLREMDDWNLYLVYQGMANVPLTKRDPGAGQGETVTVYVDNTDYLLAWQKWEDQRWRNKWIYLTGYAGTGFGYGFDTDAETDEVGWYIPNIVGGGIAGEFHFLGWMSVEAGVEIKYSMANGDSFPVFCFPALVKFPLKPSRHYMISPYLGAQYALSDNEYIVPFSFLVGAQVAVKAWSRGGFFIDLQFNLDLLSNDREYYQYPMKEGASGKNFIELGFGYKFGWRDRISAPGK